MNVLLAVNDRAIEKYVASMKECNVLKCVKNSKSLFSDTLELNPHLVIISRCLPGKENIEDIIIKIRAEQDYTRIIYLYGKDDTVRKKFTNFLIENQVYDFHVGSIDEDILNELILKPKKSHEVSLEEISEDEQKEIEEQLKAKELYIEQLREDMKKELLRLPTVGNQMSEEEIEDTIEEKIIREVVKELDVQLIERVEEIEKVDNTINFINSGQVISIVSSHRTGKSFLAKILANRLRRKCDVGLLSIGQPGYFLFEDDYIDYINKQSENSLVDFLDIHYIDNLSIGWLNEKDISSVVNKSKVKKDVVLIEGNFNKDILKCSNKLIVCFDNDYKNMLNILNDLKAYKEYINLSKTIAVITNAYIDSKSYKLIYENLSELGLMAIVTIKACGGLAYDYLLDEKGNIEDHNQDLNQCINELIICLNGSVEKGNPIFKFINKCNYIVDKGFDKVFRGLSYILKIFKSKLLLIIIIGLVCYFAYRYDWLNLFLNWIDNTIKQYM